MNEAVTIILNGPARIRVMAHYEKFLGVYYFSVDIQCENCGTITEIADNKTLDEAIHIACQQRDYYNEAHEALECSSHPTPWNDSGYWILPHND